MAPPRVPHQSYFTSTYADQVAHSMTTVNEIFACQNIVELIDSLAGAKPGSAALGYADFTTSNSPQVLSFDELSRASKGVAAALPRRIVIPQSTPEGAPCVGLLWTSDTEFVIQWLALLRLGYSVLLLAPQLRSDAICHLCETLQIRTVFMRQGVYADTAEALIDKDIEPFDWIFPDVLDGPTEEIPDRSISDIAYYCHTSGTSTGAPKPIPQYHEQLLALLCSSNDSTHTATFTTTPLYHGGLPDCLRAWGCGALLWLFPEAAAPFTPNNICAAVELAKKHCKSIDFFSCVPFVLQMLAEKKESISMLKSMKLVGVGGAALDLKTGNYLVDQGVKLISRLGSAECGFLMSSNRDFSTDVAWNYLRCQPGSDLLEFKPYDNGLFELVVTPSWPGRNVSNRPDGGYVTSDLFQPHEYLRNAWTYHSRADSQITLINGKKFDPEVAENYIRTCSDILRDVLIFGNGKEYPGVVLFLRPGVSSNEHAIQEVWPTIQSLNSSSQSHARVPRSAVVAASTIESIAPLEKSSKGTILRNRAESRYAHIIESVYSTEPDAGPELPRLSLHADSGSKALTPEDSLEDRVEASAHENTLQSHVAGIVTSALGRDVNADADLFKQGVDSIAATQIWRRLQSCVPKDGPILPRSVVYDQGTVNNLVNLLKDIQCGNVSMDLNGVHGLDEQVQELAHKGDSFNLNMGPPGGTTLVLTGGTGFLGAHIVNELRMQLAHKNRSTIGRVVCLNRGDAPLRRASTALMKYDLVPLRGSADVQALSCDLSKPDLGLSDKDIADLRTTAFLFIHCAWTVNFTTPLRAFEEDIIGLQNLINFSMSCSAHFTFISSTAAVSRTPITLVPENISHDLAHSSPLGYGQSKWAAEQNCVKAWTQYKEAFPQAIVPPLSIIRVGQLCANEQGVWNMSEAFPLMLSTAVLTGTLPDLTNKTLDWLPVDTAAQTILEITFATAAKASKSGSLPSEPPVFHVLNPHTKPSWHQMIRWLQTTWRGTRTNLGLKELEGLEPAVWIVRLQEAHRQFPNHPSVALFGLWEQEIAENVESTQSCRFGVSKACQYSGVLSRQEPLREQRVLNILDWVAKQSDSKFGEREE